MDTSQLYIEMCEEAAQVQSLLDKLETGHVIYLHELGREKLIGEGDFGWLENYANGSLCQQWVSDYWTTDRPSYHGKEGVWLPRVCELINLVDKENYQSPLEVFEHFNRFWAANPYQKNFSTKEQLWLAFTMFVSFQMKWDGQLWVND